MRLTLQRSCAACAKAKHGCDLQTPKCSRCVKRNCSCIYTNEPLTSTTAQSGDNAMIAGISQDLIPHSYARSLNRTVGGISSNISALPMTGPQSFDPFDSYPSTNLPRVRVQGLMYHCRSLIWFHETLFRAHVTHFLQFCQKSLSNTTHWILTHVQIHSLLRGGL